MTIALVIVGGIRLLMMCIKACSEASSSHPEPQPPAQEVKTSTDKQYSTQPVEKKSQKKPDVNSSTSAVSGADEKCLPSKRDTSPKQFRDKLLKNKLESNTYIIS